MPAAMLYPPELQFARQYDGFFEMFDGDPDTTNKWTLVASNDGTAAGGDASGTGLTLTPSTGTADNDEVYFARKHERVKPAAGKPSQYVVRYTYAQGATNAGNLVFGVTDGVAADLLRDNGAGPKTSGSFAAFYSRDGSLYLHAGISVSTAQTLVELTAVNSLDKQFHPAAGTDVELEIEIMPKSASLADVAFKIDGVTVYKFMDWVITSITEMQAVAGAKNGSTANEAPVLKYMGCWQKR